MNVGCFVKYRIFNFVNMKALETIKLSFVEDERMIREGIGTLIQSHPEFELVQLHETVESFLETNHSPIPQVMLLDIGLKMGMTGLEGIRLIKEKYPNVEIIMLTTFDDSERIFKALCAGASAYLTKQTPFNKISEAIKTVHGGGSYMSPHIARKVVQYFAPKKTETTLTSRQEQIVQGLVDGLSYKMVADKLMISTETVRDHIKRIYKKLEINSKAELIRKKNQGVI